MLFNPLFVQIGVNTNSADSSKSTKLNNTSYLFSDIIRVIGDNNKSADSLSADSTVKSPADLNGVSGYLLNNFDINTLTSQVAENNQTNNSINLNDLLKELLSNIQTGKNGDISSLESYLSKPGEKNIHLLSSGNDLDGFLQKLFNALPELTMVAGGDKNFIVKPVSGKTGDGVQDQKKQVEDAIVNLLQTNSNIVLNFNLGKEQFKIDITKLSGTPNIKNTGETISESSNNEDHTPKNTPGPITDGTNGIDASVQNQISEGPEVIIQNGTSLPADNLPGEKNGNRFVNEIPVNDNSSAKSAAVPVGSENPDEIAVGKITGKAVNTPVNNAFTLPPEDNKITDSHSKNIGKSAVSIDGMLVEGAIKADGQAIGEAGKSAEKENGKTVLTAQKTNTAAEPTQSYANIEAEITKNKGLTFNAEDQKYILSIKVELPKTVNTNQTAKNIETLSQLPENKNTSADPAGIGDLKVNNTGFLHNEKNINPGKELFNPPLTLKLSLKQQIKNVEQNKLDSTKIIFEKGGSKVQDNSSLSNSNDAVVKNGLNSGRNNINITEQAVQSAAGSANAASNNYTENINPVPVETADSVGSEMTGAIDKNLKGGQNKNDDNSNSAVGQIKQNINESGSPAVSAEDAGADNGNKSFNQKQKGGLKTGTSQNINDFDKLISVKDKIQGKPDQFTSTLRTIKVADITKEFASIINQKQSKSVVLQLKPENLGKIKLSIDVSNNIVHARVEVENESVKQMLQSNLEVLRHSLNLNGLQLSTVDVSMSGGQQKSYKSYGTKKKSQYTGKSTKITEEPETKVNKNLGYNTYEYLI